MPLPVFPELREDQVEQVAGSLAEAIAEQS